MLSMRIETLVNALVRQELVGKGREKEALHFHFSLGMAVYTSSENYEKRRKSGSIDPFEEHRGLHMLYYVKPGFSYISVFSAITPSAFMKVDEVQDWTHEITHDSCWAQVDTFSRAYFDMAEKINQAMVKEGLEKVAPLNMSEYNTPPLFGPVFDWVPIEISKDPNDDRGYRRLVKVLKG